MHPSSDLLDEALTQTLETREMKTELRERFIRHFQANGGKSIEDVITLFQKYAHLQSLRNVLSAVTLELLQR